MAQMGLEDVAPFRRAAFQQHSSIVYEIPGRGLVNGGNGEPEHQDIKKEADDDEYDILAWIAAAAMPMSSNMLSCQCCNLLLQTRSQTELHGMAALQWSICLDSLCRSKEAMGMYSKLKYHPNDRVSKKAKMFMFSFQAADFLKIDGVPVPRNTGYEGYFDQFGGQRNYYANPDEPEVGIRQIIPYMLFLVSPIFFVAFIALRKSLML